MIGIIDTVDDGIDWDITLDNSQIDWDIGTVEEADDSSNGLIKELSAPVKELSAPAYNATNETQERSQFLETEYSSKVLDDVFEIKAFLHQRLTESSNGDTLSLQHQVEAVAPFVLQQYTCDAIHTMLSDISLAISLLTNRKTRDLIMILNSKRFLDRLVSTLAGREEEPSSKDEKGIEGIGSETHRASEFLIKGNGDIANLAKKRLM
ncbi:hypothetical protein ACET3Z_026203 [Daucus carota]